MTPLERYLAMLDGRPVDHLPRLPILMQFAAEHIGRDYAAFASDHRVMVEGNLRCAADYGLEQVGVMSDPYRETTAFGGEIEYVANHPPLLVQPPLADDSPGGRDLASLDEPDPQASPRLVNCLAGIRAYVERAGDYSILGWVEGPAAEAADLRGLSAFMMDLIDDPTYAGDLMDRCVEAAIAFAAAQVEAGADTLGIGDAICSQLSPALYESLVLPRQRRLIDGLRRLRVRPHDRGPALADRQPVIRMHICGDITHLLPGLASLNLDILDVDHLASLVAVREAVGEGPVLNGNADPVRDILHGTPESIRAIKRRCLAEAGPRLAVGAGCEIPAGTPAANLLALCEPLYPPAAQAAAAG